MGAWKTLRPAAGMTFRAAATESGLCRLSLGGNEDGFVSSLRRDFPDTEWRRDGSNAVLNLAEEQLKAYFAGSLQRFDLPLDLRGTPFQRKVWRALARIPYGQTRSYGDVAKAIGAPEAARAVGGANRSNPVAIVVPCHRVIASGGGLGGYACGVEVKRRLLDLEAGVVAPARPRRA